MKDVLSILLGSYGISNTSCFIIAFPLPVYDFASGQKQTIGVANMSSRALLNVFSLKLILSLFLSFAVSNVFAAPSDPAAGKAGSITTLVEGLEVRLKNEPNDMKGWLLLGKSYHHLHRMDDAQMAFSKAKELGYTGELPSSTTKDGNYSGHASYHKTAQLSAPLSKAIEQVNNDSESAEARSQGIRLKVDIDPALKASLSDDKVVFVFARAVNGMRAPLAVAKKKVSELPFDITLNDDMAMMSGHNISSAKDIIVGARVSMSGSPIKQAGDYEVLSKTIPSSYGDRLSLTISK